MEPEETISSAKQFILKAAERLKELIAYYEEYKDLKGKQKKERVVDLFGKYLEEAVKLLPINPIYKFIIKTIIKAALPHLVQAGFNLIECKITGITKE